MFQYFVDCLEKLIQILYYKFHLYDKEYWGREPLLSGSTIIKQNIIYLPYLTYIKYSILIKQ